MSVTYKKALYILALVLALLAFATYYIVWRADNGLNEEAVAVFSNPEGEAPYTDLLGNPISLDQYLGSVLVVVTWASWSPFSTADIAMLRELSEQYTGKDVVFMAINRKETKEQAARFVATLPSLEGLVVALDPRDAFYTAVGGYAMPEVVVYNEQAEIVEHFRGVAPKEAIQTILEGLLAE